MTLITKGMGAIIKGGKRIKGKLGIKKRPRPGNIQSKLVKDKTMNEAEKHFANIYVLDKTGVKDKIIKSMNESIKRSKTGTAGPKQIDHYHHVMTNFGTKKYKPNKEFMEKYINKPKSKK